MSELPEFPNLAEQVDCIFAALSTRPNVYLIAIVGIPGSGKSSATQ